MGARERDAWDEGAAEIVAGGESYAVVRVLKSDAFALTRLVRRGGTLAVHKLSRVKRIAGVIPMGFLARLLLRREARIHRLLEGIPGIPRILCRDGDQSFLHEWIPGDTLNVHPGRVGDDFFPRLLAIVRAVHARGVAYVDLAKDENIVVEEKTGRPHLIDFQVSLDFGGSAGPRRWAGLLLQREDLFHLEKHVRRYRPDLAGRITTGARRKSVLNRLHGTFVKRPYNILMRRVLGLDRGRPRRPHESEGGVVGEGGAGSGPGRLPP